MFIGHHIAKGTNLASSIRLAIRHGLTAMQFCFSPPTSFAEGKRLSDSDVAQILSDVATYAVHIVCHGKYVFNFCRDFTHVKQGAVLTAEIKELNRIKCDIVLHQGKNLAELRLTHKQALDKFIMNITRALEETSDCTNAIILENSAHQGTEIGYTLEDLAYIVNSIDIKYYSRVGVCIDTCHVFVAGVLDIRNVADVKSYFSKFDELIGIERLKLIHFNDSDAKFDSHNDKHKDIGCGYIGNDAKDGGNIAGLVHIAQYAKAHKIPIVLETPSSDIPFLTQVDFIRDA